MANTFTLAGTSLDAQNNPVYVGQYMVLRTTSVGTDTDDAASYPRDSVSFEIQADGTWTSGSTLWVNGDSGILSYYEMREPSGQRVEFVFPSEVEGTTVRYEFALENYLSEDAAEQQSPALGAHIADLNNPHQVTAVQVGVQNGSGGGQVGNAAIATTGGAAGNAAIATTGFAGGAEAIATTGGAVGDGAGTTTGGAVGFIATATTGGAVGDDASASTGGAVGDGAIATTGGAVGDGANASTGGAAGNGAIATTGGAVGNFTSATTGGAVGSVAFATTGGAVGDGANASTGGAVGEDATATTGFAGGAEASAIGTGRVQLGTGTNSTDSTIQFLSSGSVTADEFGRLAGTSGALYNAGGTDVAIADGGTGASTEATARANLGFDANITSGTTPVTTTSYTPLSTDRVLLVDDTTAGGAVTINLPSAATIGDGWRLVVKKVGTDYDVTLDGDGTETIDGVLTRALHQKNDTFVIASDGANWEIASRNVVLGWANYVDSTYTSGSPLLLNAGNSYNAQCTVDGLGSGSTQSEWPDGVPEPWDTSTNKLIGTNDGDKFTYELSFKAQDGAASVLMDVYVDIGSPIGEISRSSVSIAKGASVETAIEMYRTYFTGSTFVANGGTIYFDTSQTSDDMSIWDIALLIEKTHVAS